VIIDEKFIGIERNIRRNMMMIQAFCPRPVRGARGAAQGFNPVRNAALIYSIK
jgi:hypothetical protein